MAPTVDKSKNLAAVLLGSLGGQKRTPLKAEASRINGAKGGRPRTRPATKKTRTKRAKKA